MAPNLYLLARKIACPWKFFETSSRSHEVPLHFQSEPVPGVYTKLARGNTYLVYIKSNGKRDSNNIFETSVGFGFDLQASKFDKLDRAAPIDKGNNTPPSTNSITSVTSSSAGTRSISFSIPKTPPRGQLVASRGSSASNLSLLYNKDSFNSTSHKATIAAIDIPGYRRLKHPIKVEFCDVLQRWMFTTEIRSREIIAITRPPGSSPRNHLIIPGHGGTRKQFMCLDDGISWVLTGDIVDGRVYRRHGATKNGSKLYILDEWDEMREQTEMESKANLRWLKKQDGRFLEGSNDDGYMDILRYFATNREGDLN